MFLEICDAVEYSHSRGVYHRDLKPKNIFVKDGSIKLADFGLATCDEFSTELNVGSIRYRIHLTLRYMSPENFTSSRGAKSPYYSPANDVWSLGVILFNMITGLNLWAQPSNKDRVFNFYLQGAAHESDNLYSTAPRNSFQRSTFAAFQKNFKFSDAFSEILARVFNIDPTERPTPRELKNMVIHLDCIYENQKFRANFDEETSSVPDLISATTSSNQGDDC